MSKRLFVVAVFCSLLLPAALFSQQTSSASDHGKILGVVAGNTGSPLIAADVVVRSAADSTVARTATAVDGRFLIDNLAFGTYTVRVSFVGYRTRVVERVALSKDVPNADLGTVFLDNVLITLKETAAPK